MLVIERYGFWGGMSTAALVNPWLTFHNAQGKLVVAGIAQEMLTEAGVWRRRPSFIVEARMQGNAVQSVIVRNQSGEQEYSARYFIDCTGDGDLAALAGVPLEQGRRPDGATQPMTMNFRVGGVGLAPVVKYIRENPQEFHHQTTFDQLEPLTGVSGLFTPWKEASLPMP